jgi:hypothetical protein
MSDIDTASLPTPTTDGSGLDRADPIRALAAENATAVVRLRTAQIPQHVGMAAACRALAIELPRELVTQVDAELASGVLAQRWDALRAAAADANPGGDIDVTLATVAVLLREQTRAVMRHLALRAKEWTADAYRLEGQAAALESQAERLRQIGGSVGADAQITADAASSDPAGAAG